MDPMTPPRPDVLRFIDLMPVSVFKGGHTSWGGVYVAPSGLIEPRRTRFVSFQSISDLSGAIASLADCGPQISCEFFEIKMEKFRKKQLLPSLPN